MAELLAPAGNLEKLSFALAYGADAVYVGGGSYSLRTAAGNFPLEQIEKALELTKKAGKRLYVALNIFAHQQDLKGLKSYLQGLGDLKPDALIVADPGIFKLAKKISRSIALHVSTQANVTNLESAKFWVEQGARRITLARELSLPEISHISRNLAAETEIFIHGAMCLSYSGRCWLSHYLSQRDANHGDCAQSCRWNYSLIEEQRPNEALPVIEDNNRSFILSSKDLCLAEEIPEILKAGVSSLKIEGRMKSIHYVATVTKTYRQIIDQVAKQKDDFKFDKRWIKELEKISHRQYTKGFIKPNGDNLQVKGSTSYLKSMDFVAVVEEQTEKGSWVRIKNRLRANDELELLMPASDNKNIKARFYDDEGGPLDEVHANSVVWFKEKWPPRSIIRKTAGLSHGQLNGDCPQTNLKENDECSNG